MAEADAVIPLGVAHAIAALAHGTRTIPRVDLIVGSGSEWVTAANRLVLDHTGVDTRGGPRELLVLADHLAEPEAVAKPEAVAESEAASEQPSFTPFMPHLRRKEMAERSPDKENAPEALQLS